MARIRWIAEDEAVGEAPETYAEWFRNNPGRPAIPGILWCFSLRLDDPHYFYAPPGAVRQPDPETPP